MVVAGLSGWGWGGITAMDRGAPPGGAGRLVCLEFDWQPLAKWEATIGQTFEEERVRELCTSSRAIGNCLEHSVLLI